MFTFIWIFIKYRGPIIKKWSCCVSRLQLVKYILRQFMKKSSFCIYDWFPIMPPRKFPYPFCDYSSVVTLPGIQMYWESSQEPAFNTCKYSLHLMVIYWDCKEDRVKHILLVLPASNSKHLFENWLNSHFLGNLLRRCCDARKFSKESLCHILFAERNMEGWTFHYFLLTC